MIHARDDYNRIQDPAGLIPEDEPVFLLRAQDVAAPMTVKWWAATHDAHGGDPRLSYLAKQWAERMEQWQAEHGKKRADLPPTAPKGPAKESPPQAEPVARYDAEQLRCACLDGLRILKPGMPGYAIARSTLTMLDDLAAANARVAVLESELARTAAELQKTHPIGAVKALGLREVARATKEVCAETRELRHTRDFCMPRLAALQDYQREVPEPHRTGLCNILAGGQPRVAGRCDPLSWVEIDYTNYRGERSARTVLPLSWRFGTEPPWHPDPQYLLTAYDAGKNALRTFAMANIHAWKALPGPVMLKHTGTPGDLDTE